MKTQRMETFFFFFFFFFVILLVLRIYGQEGQVFFYEKLTLRIFLIFCIKVQKHINLKLTLMTFLENKLILRYLGQKGPEMGPKWRFSGITKTKCMELFWFFAWSYSRIKDVKSMQKVFLGLKGFSDQKGPKVFSVIIKSPTMEVF